MAIFMPPTAPWFMWNRFTKNSTIRAVRCSRESLNSSSFKHAVETTLVSTIPLAIPTDYKVIFFQISSPTWTRTPWCTRGSRPPGSGGLAPTSTRSPWTGWSSGSWTTRGRLGKTWLSPTPQSLVWNGVFGEKKDCLHCIIVHTSIISGFTSLRDHDKGTWFIQSLVEVFMNHAHEKELIDLLRMTSDYLSKFTNEQVHTAFKKGLKGYCCYFNDLPCFRARNKRAMWKWDISISAFILIPGSFCGKIWPEARRMPCVGVCLPRQLRLREQETPLAMRLKKTDLTKRIWRWGVMLNRLAIFCGISCNIFLIRFKLIWIHSDRTVIYL